MLRLLLLLLLRRRIHREMLRHNLGSILQLCLHNGRIIVMRQRMIVDNANILDIRATKQNIIVDLRLRRYLKLRVAIFRTKGADCLKRDTQNITISDITSICYCIWKKVFYIEHVCE